MVGNSNWKKLRKNTSSLLYLAVNQKGKKRAKMSKDGAWLQLADYTAEVVFELLLKVIKGNTTCYTM